LRVERPRNSGIDSALRARDIPQFHVTVRMCSKFLSL
jgi:hypothetical protein